MSSIEKAINRLQKKKQSKDDEGKKAPIPVLESPVEKQIIKEEINSEFFDNNKVITETVSKNEPACLKEKQKEIPEGLDQIEHGTAAYAAKSNNKQITLDYPALEKLGFITPRNKVDNLDEEYRLIKRPILMNAIGKGAAPVPKGNLVMVTSSMPGEGKTFTSLNLAMSIAMELDLTVLLVDGDVIRASLSKTLNIGDQVGLTDLLEGKEKGVENVIISTDIPKLKIIPAGTRQSYSTELLASDRMARISDELSVRYPDRIILFDAPPLLATTEAPVLADLMGQILVVVEAGKSNMHEVKAALSTLNNEKVVGLVLNKSRKNASGYYGGYYGGYGGA